MGELGILSVGAGHNKLVFDPTDEAGMIRAARTVKDMLRRGYAMMVEVEGADGKKAFRRVHDFEEGTFEYVIADFDSAEAEKADAADRPAEEETGAAVPLTDKGGEARPSKL